MSRKWESQVRAWVERRHAREYADDFVLFFEKSFLTPLKLYPNDAWFGVHDSCISLTIGNMWLAAIAAPPRCAYLIVERDLRTRGLGYLEIRSTLRYVPLGLQTAKPWERVRLMNEDERAWEAYAKGCELILKSPISRNVITRNLYRKSRISELLSPKELQ